MSRKLEDDLKQLIELTDDARLRLKAVEANIARIAEIDPLNESVKELHITIIEEVSNVEFLKKCYERDLENATKTNL